MDTASEYIDIELSIQRGRLVRTSGYLDLILNYLTHIFFVLFAMFIGVGLTVAAFNSHNLFIETIIFVLAPMVVIAFYLVRATLNIDKLKRVQGSNRTENRKLIKSIADSMKWKTVEHKKGISILNPPTDLMTWNRTVVVLYDDKDIYLNTKAGGLFGIQSPFHGLSDRKVQKALVVEFTRVKN